MRRRKFRIRRWVALAAALVTLSFASSAAAIPVVDNDGGKNTVGLTPLGLKADGLRLQGIAQVYQSLSMAVPDVLERYAAAHPNGAGLTSATSSSEVVRGFDWNDYAIGIGSGVGFTLLLAATLGFGWQQRRRMQTA